MALTGKKAVDIWYNTNAYVRVAFLFNCRGRDLQKGPVIVTPEGRFFVNLEIFRLRSQCKGRRATLIKTLSSDIGRKVLAAMMQRRKIKGSTAQLLRLTRGK